MVGGLVSSLKGHDKGRIYVIIQEEERVLWIADGSSRSKLRPKRKNNKHVQVINRQIGISTDIEIKRGIKLYMEEKQDV